MGKLFFCLPVGGYCRRSPTFFFAGRKIHSLDRSLFRPRERRDDQQGTSMIGYLHHDSVNWERQKMFTPPPNPGRGNNLPYSPSVPAQIAQTNSRPLVRRALHRALFYICLIFADTS
ncbi:hypothetical protein HZ326_26180 [Fusarium oxysporum f. sp. albedinis]|nr:hypothetical protein HZ326_26180 [Fusarium oxysporum f. sp. albedinis]